MKIIKYKIIDGPYNIIDEKVENYINLDWQPLGGFMPNAGGGTWGFQTMVKYG